MDEIIEAIAAVLLFLFRIFVFAFYSIFLVGAAIVSPAHRRKLVERWNRSTQEQVLMISGGILGLGAILVTCIWILPALTGTASPEENVNTGPSPAENEESLKDRAIDSAAEYLKKKLKKEEEE